MSALADPPLTPKAVATRKQLLELAARMFVDRGYAAVSLNHIAKEARLTKGAIYGHFRSKGQLLVEVIRSELAKRDSQGDPATAEDPGAALAAFISPGSRELRLLQTDAAAAARHDADVEAGVREVFADRNQRILDSLDGMRNAETLAFIINALSSGIGVQEAHGRETPDPAAWTETLSPMFIAMAPDARPS